MSPHRAGWDDDARPAKRRRSESPAGGSRAGPYHHGAGMSTSTGRGEDSDASTDGYDEGEDVESEAGGGAEDWHYTLEVIQQPQRARACGFGDKQDRRPLSPPPIIRLWVRTASGRLVDPSHVSIHFLVLMVDLWSADGSQERNVVMHPGSQPARNSQSEASDYAPRPTTATSRPPTAQSGPSFSSGWRFGDDPHPLPTSPGASPLSHFSGPDGQIPPPLPVPHWQDRPALGRTSSYTPSYFDLEPVPQRPVTAPGPLRPPVPSIAHTLPPLASLTRSDAARLTLPAMRERPSIPPSSSHHRVSWSTEGSRPSFDEAARRPSSSYAWNDRPRTTGAMSSRPSTSGTLHSPRHEHPYASSESSYGFPPTPDATRMQLPPPANYSRVLVGSLTAVCQRLQDEQGQTGLFFFAHDLGIRTEGVFSLRFSLANLASLMTGMTRPGDRTGVLAEVHSEPFTVYSAKRFPGVIPTTDLTRLFANQNVRLPTRQRRTRGSQDRSDEEG